MLSSVVYKTEIIVLFPFFPHLILVVAKKNVQSVVDFLVEKVGIQFGSDLNNRNHQTVASVLSYQSCSSTLLIKNRQFRLVVFLIVSSSLFHKDKDKCI